jgi:predicted metal-binding membrane protein
LGELLSVPFAAAAVVLCAAAAAKLRYPAGVMRALATIGLPGYLGLVWALAALEMALGIWCLLAPGPSAAAAMASMYAGFAVVARVLAARRASCGCFGEGDLTASAAQSLLSAVLAALCGAAAVRTPDSLQWMLGRPAGLAGALVIAVAGCAYAIVMVYTLLPSAWSAWNGVR